MKRKQEDQETVKETKTLDSSLRYSRGPWKVTRGRAIEEARLRMGETENGNMSGWCTSQRVCDYTTVRSPSRVFETDSVVDMDDRDNKRTLQSRGHGDIYSVSRKSLCIYLTVTEGLSRYWCRSNRVG